MENKDKQNNEKRRDNNKYLLIILLLLITISIGFATMSTTLKIRGTGVISEMRWDVHFENITERSDSATIVEPATILGNTTDVEYSVVLLKPGSYYEFDVNIVNGGTIDAKLANTPSLTGITAAQDVYTNYTVTYVDGSAISENDVIAAGASRTIRVRIEIERDLQPNQLPTSNQQLDLQVDLDYIQAD